jgi:IclR family pca regulon transcriptional regulator
MKVLSLGFTFLNSSSLTKVIKPYIDHLSVELNKTMNLAVLDNLEILYLYRKEVTRYLKYDLQAGSKLPAYCTAGGKILLAGLTNREIRKRIKEMSFDPITPRTITSKETLFEEIKNTRKRGYSICDRELSMDLYSLAIPVIQDKGEVVAAVNITMGAKDKDSQIKKQIVKKLIQAGEEISRLLGYQGSYPQFPS